MLVPAPFCARAGPRGVPSFTVPSCAASDSWRRRRSAIQRTTGGASTAYCSAKPTAATTTTLQSAGDASSPRTASPSNLPPTRRRSMCTSAMATRGQAHSTRTSRVDPGLARRRRRCVGSLAAKFAIKKLCPSPLRRAQAPPVRHNSQARAAWTLGHVPLAACFQCACTRGCVSSQVVGDTLMLS